MEAQITIEIWNQITNYVTSLDWAYIITFIVIAYGFNHRKVKDGIQKVTKVRSHTKYRTAFVGLLYGVGIYFVRGYSLEKIEVLFQSFIFAIVFHKFIIDGLMKYLGRKINASSKIPYQPKTYPNDNKMV
jgi:hypothetical protein